MHLSLTRQQTNVLEALAQFQYLSCSQMVRYGVGKSRSYLRDEVIPKIARTRPALVHGTGFGVIPRIGQLEKIYHLTETGVRYIAEYLRCDPSEIVYPRYGIQFQNDYFHRKALIDFHISLRLWEKQDNDRQIDFFNAYYTKGKNRLSINNIRFKTHVSFSPHGRKTIEPDGIFSFRDTEQASPILCAVEVHRKHDTQYITQQLNDHITALDQTLIPERHRSETMNIVLSIHEKPGSLKGVQKRLLELHDFKEFMPYFHFNLMGNIRENLSKDWIKADGTSSELFNIKH